LRRMSNVVFTKRHGEDHKMHYDGCIYNCVKCTDGGIYLFAADEYTARSLSCSVDQVCGRISAFGRTKVGFEIYGESLRVGEGLYSYQTSCMPWIAAILYPGKNLLV